MKKRWVLALPAAAAAGLAWQRRKEAGCAPGRGKQPLQDKRGQHSRDRHRDGNWIRLDVPGEPEEALMTGRTHYCVGIGGVKVSFDYQPDFEPVATCEEAGGPAGDSGRGAVFSNGSGHVLFVDVAGPESPMMGEMGKGFRRAMEQEGIPVSVREIHGGPFRGFAYWMGPDPYTGEYTAGMQASDRSGIVVLTAMRRDGMPEMFGNVRISRKGGTCDVR